MVFDSFVHGQSSAEDFTLTHYGLSEANPNKGLGADRITWFLILNAAVIVCLLVAIWWRRRSRTCQYC